MVNRDNLIFAPCDILLPPYECDDSHWEKWSVIACDQHTGDKEYWKRCEAAVEGTPSTYDLILPEAYLESELEASHKDRIVCAQKSMNSSWLRKYKHSMVYIERKLSNGKTRKGIIGKIDLEHYDFSRDSSSAVRPTEGTVPERVVPRVAIREAAAFELPHIMVFMNDAKRRITEKCAALKGEMKKLYDFELMEGGGHLEGYLLAGEALESILEEIELFEKEAAETGEMPYGVGDGNHSLATAKTVYAALKEKEGVTAMNSKARYAAVEMVSIEDDSIEFEPIYRLFENANVKELADSFKKYASSLEGEAKEVTLVTKDGKETVSVPLEKGGLAVGVVQDFTEKYLESHPETVVDYIHGVEETTSFAQKENAVGFIFDGMEKCELFPYVASKGPLPRKTFSMGSADTKRYYTEARRIIAE